MSEIISTVAAWEIINAQADSGNEGCLDCRYSEGTGAGSGHTCIADHHTDCHIFESLCLKLDADLGEPGPLDRKISTLEYETERLSRRAKKYADQLDTAEREVCVSKEDSG